MLNLSRVIKPWKEADALSAHINLYGFWTETTFLTKSGDLGMVLSVTGVDYESLDNDEQQYAVKRLESALKSFGEGFHVYQYLFKTNRPDIPFASYDDALIDAAKRRRHFNMSKSGFVSQMGSDPEKTNQRDVLIDESKQNPQKGNEKSSLWLLETRMPQRRVCDSPLYPPFSARAPLRRRDRVRRCGSSNRPPPRMGHDAPTQG
jgi:type IV secretory pathway VirB4 component